MHLITKLLSIFILLSAIVGIAGIIILQSMGAPGPLKEDKVVIVKSGMGVNQIADTLETEQVISSTFLFKTAMKIFGHGTLKAGEYRFEKSTPILTVLEKLETGKVIQRQITIPEGLTSFEVVRLLNQEENLSGDIKNIPAEGTLLPETYSYSLGDTKQDKINRMQKSMQETIDELWENKSENIPVTNKQEALILASIIEKETGVAGERRKVAGVFANRLRINMALQTDPTVIYAITKGKHQNSGKGPLGRRLLRKDIQETDSPYNTYLYPGLPPGPIANPGKESIAAALNPESHDYLYFVADGTGGHIFGKTLEEHNYNAANWRKIRKEKEEKQKALEESGEISGPLFD